MKVLYIGHYKDGTGWGDAAINNILAMDSAGIEVVPRAITYNNGDSEVPERIKQLELKTSRGCDICVQHTLPVNYTYNSDFKNIGFVATESENFKDSGWQKNLNIMDEVWVPSQYSKDSCINSGVTSKVNIVPHSLDVESYKQNTNGNKIQELLNTFNFGFIGEFIERKNIKALVRAFHSEFGQREPVNLLIKTSNTNLESFKKYCDSIKRGLKLRGRYKEEVVICGRLDKKDYISVLSQCHCFVMPSRGEGFCIPALEAMSVGVPSLFTSGIALEEFCTGGSVDSYSEPCFGGVESLGNLYTANSDWKEISVKDLQRKMREAFENRKNTEQIKQQCYEQASEYSHKNIGKKIKEILNDS